jgi:hypothetical protein
VNRGKHRQGRDSQKEGNVVLIDASLFYVGSAELPGQIKKADVESWVAGLVEEVSPLPLEQLSWGYFWDPKSPSGSQLLYFAASRESVFSGKKQEAFSQTPVLPALFALHGLDLKQSSWIFLKEQEGITAVYFAAGSLFPSKSVSRFLSASNEDSKTHRLSAFFAVRDALEQQLRQVDSKAEFFPGLVRVTEAQSRGRSGLSFSLEQLGAEGEDWRKWRKTACSHKQLLIAADLRDKELTREARKKEQGVQQMKITLAAMMLLLGVLGLSEFAHWRMLEKTRTLEATNSSRASLVKQMEEIQNLTAMVSSLESRVLQPFEWLLLLNAHRPQQIHLTAFSQESAELIRMSGIADEIASVNRFVAQVREDSRFSNVNVSEVQTTREGVTFMLQVTPGVPRLSTSDFLVPVAVTQGVEAGAEATGSEEEVSE